MEQKSTLRDVESHPRVLLVEDDERLARLIEAFLVAQGFRVCSVADGQAAIVAILGDPPDCVILDMLLPGTDGLEVCRAVRGRYAPARQGCQSRCQALLSKPSLDSGRCSCDGRPRWTGPSGSSR